MDEILITLLKTLETASYAGLYAFISYLVVSLIKTGLVAFTFIYLVRTIVHAIRDASMKSDERDILRYGTYLKETSNINKGK